MADKEYLDFLTMSDNTKLYVPQVRRSSVALSSPVTLSSGNTEEILSLTINPPVQANAVLLIGQVQFAANANGRRTISIYRQNALGEGTTVAITQTGASPSGITILNTMCFTTLFGATQDSTHFKLQASYSSSTASTLQVTKASFWAMYFE